MNRKKIAVLFVVPIIIGVLFVSPLIYNWQRNKELVNQKIELSNIINIDVPPEIRNANYRVMEESVDDMFVPVIYLAFVFSYCVTLMGIVSIYLIERKEGNNDITVS